MDISRRDVLKLSGAAAVTTVAFGAAPASAAPRAQRLYLGSYTAAGGLGIGAGSIDPATGVAVIDGWTSTVADPSWLAASSDGSTVYAVSELVPGGAISALRRERPGPPSLLNTQPAGWGPAHVSVHPGGRYLFTSLYGSGSLAVHRIEPDGLAGPATDVRLHPAGSHVHQVVTDPSGRWVLAVDLGLNSVFVYTLDSGSGRLREHGRTALRPGAGARHLAFHPGGAYAYVAGERNSTVTVLRWARGVLTPGQVTGTLFRPAAAGNYPAEILTSADGRFVYVTNRGDNSIAVFSVSAGGAALRLIATTPAGGDWPRHAAIDATGRWLYVANQRSGELVSFALDAERGLVGGETGRVAAPAVAQVLLV